MMITCTWCFSLSKEPQIPAPYSFGCHSAVAVTTKALCERNFNNLLWGSSLTPRGHHKTSGTKEMSLWCQCESHSFLLSSQSGLSCVRFCVKSGSRNTLLCSYALLRYFIFKIYIFSVKGLFVTDSNNLHADLRDREGEGERMMH